MSVTQPSPTVLRQYADELRKLAGAHETRAGTIETLLDPVTKLDDTDTWAGTFADDTHTTLEQWRTRLTGTATACRTAAASWRTTARRLDEEAGDAEAAAKKKGG